MDSAESVVTFDTSHFGGWEAHTRGIGSKLMLKMGYEYGKGKCKHILGFEVTVARKAWLNFTVMSNWNAKNRTEPLLLML